MKHTTTDSLADLYFKLTWEKGGIRHRDDFFADEANLYRDYFPLGIGDRILNKALGDSITLSFEPGELVSPYTDNEIHRVRHSRIDTHRLPRPFRHPRKGRFYPKGILNGLAGIYRDNVTPFRVNEVEEEFVHADFNHPLSKHELTLSVNIVDIRDKRKERGGLSNDWLDLALSGPGIQSRHNGSPADFFSDDPFARDDDQADSFFYKDPRLVSHIDDKARENLSTLYGTYLRPDSRVLDLMSSWQSHLPEDFELKSVTGLGMNEKELESNPRLTSYVVRDLNESPDIPFEDGSFDAVICSLSVEYLTRPFEVFREIARVLSPGGQCIITFSNRWFPTKAIRIWPHLHEFEREGLVKEYLMATKGFKDMKTHSVRGYPRPYTDTHFPKLRQSDPLYLVYALKS